MAADNVSYSCSRRSRAAGEDAPIDLLDAAADRLGGEVGEEVPMRGVPHPPSQRRVAAELPQPRRRLIDVGHWHDEALDLVADDVAAADHVGGDDRAAGGRGL